jgi:pimeloyl-ACP methyl ester carboxylesterase
VFGVLTVGITAGITGGCGATSPDGTGPSAAPGIVTERVTLDGTAIDIVVLRPPEPNGRVVLAFPPGGQDLELTTRIVQDVYAGEATARGWTVVSPAAPSTGLWFAGSEHVLPALVDHVVDEFEPTGGRVHLLGVSNGGISAFRAVRLSRSEVASLTVYPGFPTGDDDVAEASRLTDIPVRLFVGGDDEGWVRPMEDLAAVLESAGGDVEITVLPGEGHRIETLRDGRILFDTLDEISR